METTINKKSISELTSTIKHMAEEQIFLKNQRKTEKIVGKRIISANEAFFKHYINRKQLRIMYAAYSILRGKEISSGDSLKFENEWERNSFMLSVHQVVDLYEGVKHEV